MHELYVDSEGIYANYDRDTNASINILKKGLQMQSA